MAARVRYRPRPTADDSCRAEARGRQVQRLVSQNPARTMHTSIRKRPDLARTLEENGTSPGDARVRGPHVESLRRKQ